jgi:hypothetical protein
MGDLLLVAGRTDRAEPGSTVKRPQRSEDERPCCRRGLSQGRASEGRIPDQRIVTTTPEPAGGAAMAGLRGRPALSWSAGRWPGDVMSHRLGASQGLGNVAMVPMCPMTRSWPSATARAGPGRELGSSHQPTVLWRIGWSRWWPSDSAAASQMSRYRILLLRIRSSLAARMVARGGHKSPSTVTPPPQLIGAAGTASSLWTRAAQQ